MENYFSITFNKFIGDFISLPGTHIIENVAPVLWSSKIFIYTLQTFLSLIYKLNVMAFALTGTRPRFKN
jgi:hypothetical protein